MGPGDAVAALRSFPRRWRGAFALTGDDDDGRELLSRHPDDGRPSALDRAGLVRAGLDRWDERIRQALTQERPTLTAEEPGGATPPDAGAAVEGLSASAETLAGTLGGVASGDWDRRADLGGQEVTVLAMAQSAAHDGAHHLRAVERLLRDLKGRSAT